MRPNEDPPEVFTQIYLGGSRKATTPRWGGGLVAHGVGVGHLT